MKTFITDYISKLFNSWFSEIPRRKRKKPEVYWASVVSHAFYMCFLIYFFQQSIEGYIENESESGSVVSDSLQPHRLYCPWNSPGQNTGVGSCSLLQGIFPIQGSNPGLPHCRQILYQLTHQRSLKDILFSSFNQEENWDENDLIIYLTLQSQ